MSCADLCTVDALLAPMMGKPSVKADRCMVCGRTWPLNEHHIVFRSAGTMIVEGRELAKPTVTLCGSGNASGCHGLAHSRRLHFRWHDEGRSAGWWEFLLTDEPTKYQDALAMDGWRRL